MADSLNQFTRRTKVFYELIYNQLLAGKQGIDQLLFPVNDIDPDSSNFALDKLVKDIHGVSFRNRGEQSVVRPYEAGTGTIYEVPRASEKTMIDERIRDAVIVGGEETEGFGSREGRLISQIIRQHTVAHTVTRWKLALDVLRTGSYSPTGLDGNAIGLAIDFSRDASNDLTYDFTEAGASMMTALKNMYDQLSDQGAGRNDRAVIMGSDWLAEYESDSDVLTYLDANQANQLVEQNMMPPELANTQGLYVVGRIRIQGTVSPVWVLAYEPQGQFVQYDGATATDFMPSDEAVMFTLGASRYKVIRGVDVLDQSGNAQRTAGDIVFDNYSQKDPVATILRSQARYAFIPAEIDHTARSTGTFSES